MWRFIRSQTSTCRAVSATMPTRQFAVVHKQDRILADGSLVPALSDPKAEPSHPVPGTEAAVPAAAIGGQPFAPAAPVTPPLTDAQLQQLVDYIVESRHVVVLTGAGCSTESNVPDYRGPRGAYSTGFKPMTHQKFMSGPRQQARYWSRSFAGWYEFANVRPNAAHEAIARLQARGWLGPLITQNVDRLHHKAGSKEVVELHGTTHEVVCMGCGAVSCRAQFQRTLAALNPDADVAARALVDRQTDPMMQYQRGLQIATVEDDGMQLQQQQSALVRRPDGDVEIPMRRPDGDVELRTGADVFVVPPCERCGGLLKPRVVFFGDGVPAETSQRALSLAGSCDLLLVVGSSLMVYSAYRLAKAASAAGARLVAITAGPTRADGMLDMKAEVRAGEALARLAAHPQLLLPRV